MTTAPYSPAAVEALKDTHEHIYKITVDPVGYPAFDVEAENLRVTFAEDWTPHIQADITAAIPSIAELDLLDSRLNCRVQIEAGYRYQNGIVDVQPLADLGLRTRDVRRPTNQVQFTASSDEARAQDRCRVFDFGEFTNFTGINELVQNFADYAVYPETATVLSDYPAEAGFYSIYGLTAPVGTPMWDVIADAAGRTGVWVHCDNQRRWRIRYRATTATTSMHTLEVGTNGTIITADSKIDRAGWANQSVIEYSWTDAAGDDHKVYGRATVTAGPYSVNMVGYKTDSITINRAATQSQANEAARSRVSNLVTRGRSVTIEAIAAYWLRPGMTITVQLPTGEAELHLIKSITFEPAAGTMTVETRQPVDVTITTGE